MIRALLIAFGLWCAVTVAFGAVWALWFWMVAPRCNCCGADFDSSDELARHIRTAHIN